MENSHISLLGSPDACPRRSAGLIIQPGTRRWPSRSVSPVSLSVSRHASLPQGFSPKSLFKIF